MSKLGNVIEVVKRADSWVNALTGLGSALRDKLTATQFQQSVRLSDATLEALYHGDDCAARICDALPEEALRRGYYLNVEDDTDLAPKVAEYEKRLRFKAALREAAVWARVFGGAAVYLGVDDGQDPRTPVNEKGVRTIRFATVLDRRDLIPDSWYGDPLKDARYGEPKTYRIQSVPVTPGGGTGAAGAVIHESRLLLFGGARTSLRRRLQNNGWPESVLQKVHEVLVQFGTGWQGTAHLLQDAAQGVFKIDGLVDMIASGDKETLQTRMEMVDMSRSVAHAIMVDAEREDFTRVAYSFAGVPEVLRSFMLRLAAAARMPVTVLMGQSPAGLNATGESDTRMWYDQVQAYQGDELKPAIERFYTLLFAAADFDGEEPETWDVRFEKLWQLSDMEQATLEKTVADKDKVYIDAGVVLAEEIALCRFPSRGFSMETSIDLEAREEMMQAELELAKSKAGEEPVPPPIPGQPPQMPFGKKAPVTPVPGGEPGPPGARADQQELRLDFVRQVKGKWCVYSKEGKLLGTHPTKEEAEAQLRTIEANKHG